MSNNSKMLQDRTRLILTIADQTKLNGAIFNDLERPRFQRHAII